MKKVMLTLPILALLLGTAGGYLLGQVRPERTAAAPTGSEERRLRAEVARLRRQLAARGEIAATHDPSRAMPSSRRTLDENPADKGTVSLDRGLGLESLLARLEASQDRSLLWAPETVELLEEKVREAVASGNEPLAALLERYRKSQDPELAELIAVALGLTGDPAVERAALEMAVSGSSTAERMAGLSLLEKLEGGSPPVTRAIAKMLIQDGDPQILGSALRALHREALPSPDVETVVASLRALGSNADAEVRRSAFIALGEWCRDSADLAVLVSGLSDRSAEARAGAAIALSQSRITSPEAAQALAGRVADSAEDRTVRELALDALRSYPANDPRIYEVYAVYKAELKSPRP